ncbi:MAG: zinc-dependent peptidase [Gammaproteobacteria bacterium]|nr:zinc-dependent peptidase [Gammaproteobacteria bacterium]
MFSLRDWRRGRVLRRFPLDETLWAEVIARLPVIDGLNADELGNLRELCTLFMHEKSFEATQGLDVTPRMQLSIAAQACLPILNLGLDWYDGWSTIIVYPGEFVHRREDIDEAGVVHEWDEVHSGESWEYGPVILSWADVEASGRCDGYNVVIHELAHKLDMLSGEPNGFPPLQSGMDVGQWSQVFSVAFENMNHRLDAGHDTAIDPYAAGHPAEFFAVLSEYFFEMPRLLQNEYPEVFAQLEAFYRQDTLRRLDKGL